MSPTEAHRCAVCWTAFKNHDDWFRHAEQEHGAVLAELGFAKCQKASCPGVEHAKQLPNYGNPRVKKAVDLERPIKGRDGTVYTPIPLEAAEVYQ